jgi:hypothetical protein
MIRAAYHYQSAGRFPAFVKKKKKINQASSLSKVISAGLY